VISAVTPLRHVATSTAGEFRSAVYEGTIRHRRFGPGPAHDFSYEIAMPLIDLGEVERVTALHPLWSSRHAAPAWFRRSDYLGDAELSLDSSVRDLVEERTGQRPAGRIALLANVRTWGWLFNPITMYFCAADLRGGITTLVVEVENTPWHERCAYVVGPPGLHRFAKTMHVSPFLPMDVDYALRYSAPGDRLVVQFDVMHGDERMLSATMSMRRRGMDRDALARILSSHPAPTHRVSAGIYAQAARLRLRGAPFYKHPARRGGT